jgi:hypothetical protein
MPKLHNRRGQNVPTDAVYIGRGSPYGNPYIIGEHGDRDEVCDKFEEELLKRPDLITMIKTKLRGKDLVCFCAPKRCHGETLMRIANEDPEPAQSTMRLAIVGSRDFNDYPLLHTKVVEFAKAHGVTDSSQLTVLSGRARGADKLGEYFANQYTVELEYYVPDWNGLGKRAGFVRNEQMSDAATHVIAFWDGVSRGTRHMIDYSQRMGKTVEVVYFTE